MDDYMIVSLRYKYERYLISFRDTNVMDMQKYLSLYSYISLEPLMYTNTGM